MKNNHISKSITETQWIQWNTSVWSIDLSLQKIFVRNREDHPCPTTPEVYYRLMLLFSHPGDTIVDIFCGTGTGACVAKLIDRNFFGIDINPNYVDLAKKNIEMCNFSNNKDTKQIIIQADTSIFPFKKRFADLIITSPPYFNNIRYSQNPADLSNFRNLEEYLKRIAQSFRNAKRALKPSKYLAIIVGDAQKGKKYIPLHCYLINILKEDGWVLTHLWISHSPPGTKKRKTNKLLGFPDRIYADFDHEYILVFQSS